jgi:septal ring factor EnvC (AmiA/AmiB activator)
MDTETLIVTIVMSLLGGGTVGVLGVKLMNRKIDGATAAKIKAEAEQIATKTANDAALEQINMMRTFVQDQRQSYEAKLEEQAQDRADAKHEIINLKERVGKLEERERHMLTRAAVHEAWDRMSFEILSRMDPNHPHPPPLIAPEVTGSMKDDGSPT